MTFFGLTALGPKSCFSAAAKESGKTLLHVFEECDLKVAFQKIDKENCGYIKESELRDFLSILYQGPPPDYLSEEGRLREIIQLKDNGLITWKELLKAHQKIRVDIESLEDKICIGSKGNFSSHQEYCDFHRRHSKLDKNIEEQLVYPITSAQDYGWHSNGVKDVNRKVFGKKTCYETKYASEMVKSGEYY